MPLFAVSILGVLSQTFYIYFLSDAISTMGKHDTDDLPLILAGHGGGTIRTGRRLTSPEKTPLCNLYRSMMQRMGVEVEEFGTSTGLVDLA